MIALISPMIPSLAELGQFTLCLAFVQALVGLIVSVALPQNTAVPRLVLRGNLVFVLLAFGLLMSGFIRSDFSLALVAAHSHTLKPLLYKIAGVWGNHEGSLLLWVLILCLYGAAFSLQKTAPDDVHRTTCVVQNGLTCLFLGLSLFTSNPFQRVFPPPFEGHDLNPLLQDAALAFHPPLLYLGYVGYSLVFALAVAGLWHRRIDITWARVVRPWALLAWVCLTGGLTLGSWWAYYELGWGGWWFWDPVENAALLPWLTGTALFHSLIVLEKRRHLPNWTVLLALTCFCLSLLGTFLVRSGVITSVHAFASDPTRGLFILGMLAVVLLGSFVLYAVRRPVVLNDMPLEPLSRETALILNNLFLIAGMVTVLVGTLYPYILDTLTGTLISVGPPYFALTFVPLMLPLLALMALGPFIAWGRMPLDALWRRVRMFTLVTVFIAVYVLQRHDATGAYAIVCLTSGVWIILGSLAYWFERAQGNWRALFKQPASVYAVTWGHAGLGVAILGMTGSLFWASQANVWLHAGETTQLGVYTIRLDDVTSGLGPNYNTDMAHLSVTDAGRPLARLQPEKRWYPVAEKDTTEIAIHPVGVGDLYAGLGREDDDRPGRWLVRVSHHPLISCLWGGAVLLILGGLCALFAARSSQPGRSS